jgi:hypothetical protein
MTEHVTCGISRRGTCRVVCRSIIERAEGSGGRMTAGIVMSIARSYRVHIFTG